MSAIAEYNLIIPKGTDFSQKFNIKINDVIVDLTGAIGVSVIRSGPTRKSPIIAEFDVTFEDVGPDPAENWVVLTLSDENSVDVRASEGYYDVLISIGANDRHWLRGTVTFADTVSEKP